jgi:hypothetical protein
MKTVLQQRVRLQGEVFGARGCSGCSCDPCDCNPCNCGESLIPSYPAWRVSGYRITSGEIHGVDVSQHLILSLAQPVREGGTDEWQEVILVDQQATPAQIDALLAVCEDRLESIPAEVTSYVRRQRDVYQMAINYTHGTEGPILQVTFVKDQATLVREGANPAQIAFQAWVYDGPMALREILDLDA